MEVSNARVCQLLVCCVFFTMLKLSSDFFSKLTFSKNISGTLLECQRTWPRGYETFSMLNSAEHEIYPAHDVRMPTIKMQHFNIY